MQRELLKNETLSKIASNHGKTIAQVILKWDIQEDLLITSIKNKKTVHKR